jgi:predicted nuclease of predicted toxin-antitoxin system
MKLLLDECTPKRLRNDFPAYAVQTVEEAGMRGLKNGELLRSAVAEGFDVLITVDRRLRFQQNLSQFNLALVVLIAKPCRYEQLSLLVPDALKALETIMPGDIVLIY